GRYPKSDNLEEFWQNLISGEALYTHDTRWPGQGEMPKKAGVIKCLDNFDFDFFRIPKKNADQMDPQIRISHETTYEAIIDAGYNPSELAGKRTGYYIGYCYDDSKVAQINNPDMY